MKKIAAILGVLVLIAGTCYGQKEKRVESSASRAPKWIGLSDADRFSVSAEGETLDAAQRGCMDEIKQHIVNSIAVNITSTESFSQDALIRDGVTKMLTRYSTDVGTQAADMPYLCGISLSKATGIYWERRFVKQQKRYYYICYVQYPFSEAERRAAIDDFMRIDQQYENRLETLQRNFHTFTDLSYIGEAVNELNTLIEYFFDANRRQSATALQSEYIQARREVAIVPDATAAGVFRYHLALHGRSVSTTSSPSLKSDYATDLRVMPEGEGYVLLYNALGIDSEENTIRIAYPFGKDAVYTLVFNPNEGKVSVRAYGTVSVECSGEDGSHWRISIPLRSRTDNEFEIERIEMSAGGTSISAAPSANCRTFRGRGEHLLTVETEAPGCPAGGILAEGYLRIRNPYDNTTADSKFTLPYKTNVQPKN